MLIVLFLIEFPRKPTGIIRRHIADEADARLGFYLTLPREQPPPAGEQVGARRRLPGGVVDTPLVRVFNFLREFVYSGVFLGGNELSFFCFHVRDDVVIVSIGDPLVSGMSLVSLALPSHLAVSGLRVGSEY
jgi:hypothetical protein